MRPTLEDHLNIFEDVNDFEVGGLLPGNVTILHASSILILARCVIMVMVREVPAAQMNRFMTLLPIC